jgi:hypothetical protein
MMTVWDHLEELREERLVIRKFQGKMLTFKVASSICNVLGRRRDRRYSEMFSFLILCPFSSEYRMKGESNTMPRGGKPIGIDR